MQIPETLTHLEGAWHGSGRLWFDPSAPPHAEFEATATITTAARRNVLAIAYGWSYEGEPQEGLLIVGLSTERGIVEASWVDSWHMADQFMACQGADDSTGVVSVLGYYPAPPGPDWGWRTDIQPIAEAQWRLTMYNVPPDNTGDAKAFEILFER